MFSRVLVANRGEIAVRVVRGLHELGVEAVAVYSTADGDALHVALADRAVCIGPPAAADSYLRIPNLVAAAETTACEAVHPGTASWRRTPLRAGVRGLGARVHRATRGRDGAHGGQGAGQARAGSGRVPLVPGSDGRATLDEAREAARGGRAPDPPEGMRRRRGEGNADGALGGRLEDAYSAAALEPSRAETPATVPTR